MSEEVKKISFGFSKFAKKTSIVSSKLNQVKVEENKVEFIDCLEGKSIKLKDFVEPEKKLLVIPLTKQTEITSSASNQEKDTNNKYENCDTNAIGKSNLANCVTPLESGKDSTAESNTSVKIEKLTLDEIAAKEILEELNNKDKQEETRVFSVPLTNSALEGEKESSLEDYDNVPVMEFGIAMLRGMGWAPGKGIGKNEKLITPTLPTVRPKGMGLGADKVVKVVSDSKIDEDVKMIKGSFIRVIAGTHKDSYGKVEGFDDESGRVIVKLALANLCVSLNEFMVQLVDQIEFNKNSKVINVGKYERYKDENTEGKDKQSQNKVNLEEISSHDRREEISEKSEHLLKHKKPEKYNKNNSTSSEGERSSRRITVTKRNSTPPRKSTTSYNRRSKSASTSPEDNRRSKQKYSRSPSIDSISYSRKSLKNKSSHGEKSVRKASRKYSSSSPDSSSSSSDYSRKKQPKKKKHRSYKQKSRSRSRSPRKHSTSHKKHKKSKY